MNNPKKTARPVMPQAQMTDQEKKEAVARVISQKRETFAINILCNLCRTATEARAVVKGSNPNITTIEVDTKGLVHQAVQMADALIEELYPLPETPTDQS